MHGKDKMKAINLIDDWPEVLSLIVLIIGFIVSLLSGSAVVSYIIIFFCGSAFGRFWWKRKTSTRAPWVLVMIGFLIGFLLGTYFIELFIKPPYGSKGIIAILFLGSIALSYYLHEKNIIKSIGH